MKREDENGYILVTSILLLMVMTVIGMAALGTSSIENILSGNIRIIEENEAKADMAIPHIPDTIGPLIKENSPMAFESYVGDEDDADDLADELRSRAFDRD